MSWSDNNNNNPWGSPGNNGGGSGPNIDQVIQDLKRNIRMEAKDMVGAHKIELDKENPNYNAIKADAHLEQKVEKVSSKFP